MDVVVGRLRNRRDGSRCDDQQDGEEDCTDESDGRALQILEADEHWIIPFVLAAGPSGTDNKGIAESVPIREVVDFVEMTKISR